MKSREELFEDLKNIFHPTLFIPADEAVISLLNGNDAKLVTYQDKITECEQKVFTWLGLFDSQTDDEGRQNVINSITVDVAIDLDLVNLANPNQQKIF